MAALYRNNVMPSHLYRLLRWILGTSSYSCLHGIDEDEFFDIIVQNGLVFRLWKKLSCNNHAFPVTTVARAAGLYSYWRQLSQQQLEAAAEIASMFRESGLQQCVLMKGWSVFALTGNPAHFPVSGDIDILAADFAVGNAFKDYSVKLNSSEDHEMAFLRRGPINVEVHRFIQSWRYLGPLKAAFAEGAAYHERLSLNGTHWHNVWMNDIKDYSVPSKISKTDGLVTPNTTLTVLLLCIHSFRHYLEPSSWRLKLSEIANIFDLMRQPTFDPALLEELSARHMAGDALSFVGEQIRCWYGLELDKDALSRRLNLPVRLTDYGGWAAPFTVAELPIPLPYRDVYHRLGISNVVYTETQDESLVLYGTSNTSGSVQTLHALTHFVAEDEKALDFIFCATSDVHGLVFHIFVPKNLVGDGFECGAHMSDENGGMHSSEHIPADFEPPGVNVGLNDSLYHRLIARRWWDWKRGKQVECLLYVFITRNSGGIVTTVLVPITASEGGSTCCLASAHSDNPYQHSYEI